MSLRKTNNRFGTQRVLLSCLIILIMMIDAALAGTNTLMVMPPRGRRPTSGLQMVIDTSWVDSKGYRPVRVTFRPIGQRVFPADRDLVVDLRPGRYNSTLQTRIEASRLIELPEGAASASTTVYVPMDGSYGTWAFRVHEDGRLLKDLTRKIGQSGSWTSVDAGMPAMALLTYDVPSLYERRGIQGSDEKLASQESIAELTSLTNASMGWGQAVVPKESWLTYPWRQISSSTTNFEFLRPSDLPELLPGLSSLDLILVLRSDLERMAKEDPKTLDLLRRWMFAGGNLCVSGGGQEFEDKNSIESLLRMPPASMLAASSNDEDFDDDEDVDDDADEGLKPTADYSDTAANAGPHTKSNSRRRTTRRRDFTPPVDDGWRLPRIASYGNLAVEFRNARQRRGDSSVSKRRWSPDDSPPFAIRQAQFGQLVLIESDEFDLDDHGWNWMFKTIPHRAWKWSVRQGLDLETPNDGFWDFTIPGVGLPPVTSFQVLITIFALVIGPLNYLLLRRKRRLSWIMLTVPLGSVTTIAGLVLFAVFTDGIAVRARIRSLTHIDQRTQHAVSFSRQSYYAGIAPGDGLAFAEDTIVLPIEPTPVTGEVFAKKRRVVEHRGDKMYFKVGYLPSRTPVQYMVTASQGTDLKLDVDLQNPEAPQVTNGLGSPIETVLFRDNQGAIFVGEKIPSESQLSLTPISSEDASTALVEIFDRDPLEPPLGLDRSLLRDGLIGDNWRYRQDRHGNRTSPMERLFTRLSSGQVSYLPNNSYLAVVTSCVEVPLGAQNCDVRSRLDLIMGQL